MAVTEKSTRPKTNAAIERFAKHVLLYLTAIWLVSFAATVLVVNSYVRIVEGKYILAPDDRWQCLQPLVILYGGYLTGILTFWFLKPFKKPTGGQIGRVRAVLAVVCTAVFNIVIFYLVSQNYLSSDGSDVFDNVTLAVKVAAACSFLVAPVNFYYFGMK